MDQETSRTAKEVEKILTALRENLNNLTSLERFTPVESDIEDFILTLNDYAEAIKQIRYHGGSQQIGPLTNRLLSGLEKYTQLVKSGSDADRTEAFYTLLGFATDVAFHYTGRASNTLVSEFTARSTKRAVVGLATNKPRFKLIVSPLVKWLNKAYLTNDQVRDGLKDMVLADAHAVDELTQLLELPRLNLVGNFRHRYALYVAAHKVERSQEPTKD